VLRRTLIGAAVLAVLLGAWLVDRGRHGPAWATATLAALVMLVALDELQRMGGADAGRRTVGRIAALSWLGILLLAALTPGRVSLLLADILAVASLLAGAAATLLLAAGPGPAGARLARSLWFQLPYVGGLACFVSLLLGGALDFCVHVVLVAKASDTGAYFAGSLLGGRKLAPSISPGKTWAGALGGVVLPAVAGAWLLPGLQVHAADGPVAAVVVPDDALLGALAGIVLGVVAIAADLCESLLKRSVGVKDSSALLGPAGGLLDLSDTLLLVGPIALAYTAVTG
jgi:phosphatidate cytidylyltransferase